jgi:Flp pilus assembly protein TadG
VRLKDSKRGERGAALVEFAIGALVFLTAVFAVIESGRLLWTHNALTDAARRGARYAVNHRVADAGDAAKVTVYGTTDDGAKSPLVYGLTTGNVKVDYSAGYSVGGGTATVTIINYDFDFVVPLLGKKLRMPAYSTTLTGESAGEVPLPIP